MVKILRLHLTSINDATETNLTTKRARRSWLTIELRQAWRSLTLNDPPANTYSYEMMQQLDARILEARMDESVQVIVITGSGEKFFCAGANIRCSRT